MWDRFKIFANSTQGLTIRFTFCMVLFAISVLGFYFSFIFDAELRDLVFWGFMMLVMREPIVDLVKKMELLSEISAARAKKHVYAWNQSVLNVAHRTIWQHKKRGSKYHIAGMVRLQYSTEVPKDGDFLYLYQETGSGEYSARSPKEFLDGRFEVVSAPSRTVSSDLTTQKGPGGHPLN